MGADHYFDESPTAHDRRRTVTATIWGATHTFTTASGVFAHDGLDKATALLLRQDPPVHAHSLLDLGCGWGPIACALALAVPGARVHAVDINERARELTALNAERLGAAVHVHAPDAVPDHLVFDEIWSNPPIRIGKQALHELLLRWLPRLAPGGHARMVVGKNLGADSLQRWLGEHEWPTERLASEKGFRILETRRPDASR